MRVDQQLYLTTFINVFKDHAFETKYFQSEGKRVCLEIPSSHNSDKSRLNLQEKEKVCLFIKTNNILLNCFVRIRFSKSNRSIFQSTFHQFIAPRIKKSFSSSGSKKNSYTFSENNWFFNLLYQLL